MTQRDDMGKVVGGGFRIGDSCTPWQIHVSVWQNQYSIVKVKKKKKTKFKNKLNQHIDQVDFSKVRFLQKSVKWSS